MTRPRIERRLVPGGIALDGGLHPVLARVFAARGIVDPAELDDSLDALEHWEALGGIRDAAAILADALDTGACIVVVGDFDADGATACALTCSVLRALGARSVMPLVPNRFEYGYGLTPEIVDLAIERHAPDLIVTVDNGVSSHAGVAAARARGIKVIVTDHHLPGETLPDADAIVNPNLPGDAFPSKALSGVGAVFYLMLALRQELEQRGWFVKHALDAPRLADWLDLVAIGTVADVVPLDRNNRILVAQGLKRIRAGRSRPGVDALLRQAGRDPARAVASDIGFALAPRLNAAGRLEDMSLGIACLLESDTAEATRMAAELDAINSTRREIEREMHDEALRVLERLEPSGAEPAVGICLYDPRWHEGVIGILAGRVKERLHRPVVAFARTASGELKGSARSIPGFHIRDALDTVAARRPDLLQRFGGHAMAAGLSLAEEAYTEFTQSFDQVARERLSDTDLERVTLTDGQLRADEISRELAEALRDAGPWGQSFPEPLFEGRFAVADRRVVGERHLKFRLRHDQARHDIDAIAFNASRELVEGRYSSLFAVYRLDLNEWRGMRKAQLVIEYAEPV